MQFILHILDQLWNMKFIKGYRTQLARAIVAAIAFYQWLSTAPQAMPQLPDLAPTISGPILVYIAAKIKQFAEEHKPA